MNLKQYIIDNLLNSRGNLNPRALERLRSTPSEFLKLLLECRPGDDLRTSILEELKGECLCETCGNVIRPYPLYANKTAYFCSSNCGNNSAKKLKAVSVPRSEETSRKIEDTCKKKYGSLSPFHSAEIQTKVVESVFAKYGVSNVSSIPHVKDSKSAKLRTRDLEAARTKRRRNILSGIGLSRNEIDSVVDKNFGFTGKPNPEFVRWRLSDLAGVASVEDERFGDLSLSAKYKILHFHGHSSLIKKMISQNHAELIAFLDKLGVEYIVNDRKTIAPKELDIFIPSHNLAIEVNGLLWHSENFGGIDKHYHLNKTKKCQEVGVRLIHFFEYDDIAKIKSLIESSLGMTRKIGARNCVLVEVPREDAVKFFNAYHRKGNSGFSKTYGLYHSGVLVQAISIGAPRFKSHGCDFEIVRMASLITVIGGASRLIKFCSSLGSLVTYSDMAYGMNRCYSLSGMSKIGESSPSYVWFKGDKTLSRYQTQKSKLGSLLGSKYDPGKSETGNMILAGYDRVWNCGHEIFILK